MIAQLYQLLVSRGISKAQLSANQPLVFNSKASVYQTYEPFSLLAIRDLGNDNQVYLLFGNYYIAYRGGEYEARVLLEEKDIAAARPKQPYYVTSSIADFSKYQSIETLLTETTIAVNQELVYFPAEFDYSHLPSNILNKIIKDREKPSANATYIKASRYLTQLIKELAQASRIPKSRLSIMLSTKWKKDSEGLDIDQVYYYKEEYPFVFSKLLIQGQATAKEQYNQTLAAVLTKDPPKEDAIATNSPLGKLIAQTMNLLSRISTTIS